MVPIYLANEDEAPAASGPPSAVEFLMTLAFINTIAFSGWLALINNFAREQAAFGWFEIGLMQSMRELPGLLAFTAVYWLRFMREQTLSYAGLGLLAGGVALTGLFPTLGGIVGTTLLMSFGFHYFEAALHSMQLQLLRGPDAARQMGRIHGAAAAAQFLAFGAALLLTGWLGALYVPLFFLVGIATIIMLVFAVRRFPRYEGAVEQGKSLVLRRRYSLYYGMTFMSGARRQIFVAFGAFLLVDKFGMPVDRIALLYLVTALASAVLAPKIGGLVARLGERHTMILENVLLIAVFTGYALTSSPWVAAILFVVDGVSTSLTIAQRTYIQKIGDPTDMRSQTSVGFAFNHIAAVAIPVAFGALGRRDPSIIFWLGTGIATLSLSIALMVPADPRPGAEARWPIADLLARRGERQPSAAE